MNSAQPAPSISPELIFETMNAYHRTEALRAAIELDLFTAIGEGATDPKSLAASRKASERGMRILCDYLVIIGLLSKQGSSYALTPDSAAFLNRRSPMYMGSAANFLSAPDMAEMYRDVAGAVRRGGTVAKPEGTLEAENPLWVVFARSMAPLMFLPAELIAKSVGAAAAGPVKVLDVAAGHGTFGITIATHNPQAEIFAVDWSNVLEVAKENAEKAGVAGRYRTIPGSAFDVDYGKDYDLVLLTNFQHHFDPPTNETLLRKIRAALKPGGRVVSLEFIPNEDRVTPKAAGAFSLIMLASTPSGDAYTFAEYQRMYANAGFTRTELREIPPAIQRLLVAWK